MLQVYAETVCCYCMLWQGQNSTLQERHTVAAYSSSILARELVFALFTPFAYSSSTHSSSISSSIQ
eukprot:1756143-Rhodomonas_salina.1